jgi:DNA-3-methyladenine glycosylase I
MTFPYRTVFQQVEESLIQYGSQHLPQDQIRVALDFYKTFAERELTDALSFALLRDVVFYSGFRAATVTARMNTIKCWFPDWRTVTDYSDADVAKIMSDSGMIREQAED